MSGEKLEPLNDLYLELPNNPTRIEAMNQVRNSRNIFSDNSNTEKNNMENPQSFYSSDSEQFFTCDSIDNIFGSPKHAQKHFNTVQNIHKKFGIDTEKADETLSETYFTANSNCTVRDNSEQSKHHNFKLYIEDMEKHKQNIEDVYENFIFSSPVDMCKQANIIMSKNIENNYEKENIQSHSELILPNFARLYKKIDDFSLFNTINKEKVPSPENVEDSSVKITKQKETVTKNVEDSVKYRNSTQENEAESIITIDLCENEDKNSVSKHRNYEATERGTIDVYDLICNMATCDTESAVHPNIAGEVEAENVAIDLCDDVETCEKISDKPSVHALATEELPNKALSCSLDSEWKGKSNSSNFKCCICGHVSLNLKKFKYHIFLHESREVNCTICQKKYRRTCHLTQHINRCHM